MGEGRENKGVGGGMEAGGKGGERGEGRVEGEGGKALGWVSAIWVFWLLDEMDVAWVLISTNPPPPGECWV